MDPCLYSPHTFATPAYFLITESKNDLHFTQTTVNLPYSGFVDTNLDCITSIHCTNILIATNIDRSSNKYETKGS